MLQTEHTIWDFLDTGGQIIRLLLPNAATAGDIYQKVAASQPVVSKKLARMQDEGILESRRDPGDRRVVWYSLSDAFRTKLLGEGSGSDSRETKSL